MYGLELTAKSLYELIAANFGDILGEKAAILREIAKEEDMHARLVEKLLTEPLGFSKFF
ncbi:MAG: hypothetical protein HA489_04820 [Archaeoglobales archaeon]|nr:hypothetical protein [Archaeoglobales archaeon]